MAETPYTNRELDTHFNNLIDHMRGFESSTGQSLARIEAQVAKTNGRVGRLEQWRYFMMGGLSILSLLVVPLLIAYLKGDI